MTGILASTLEFVYSQFDRCWNTRIHANLSPMTAETVDIPEAARILGVSEGRVRQLVADGILESRKINPTRIPLTAIVERMQAAPQSGRPKKAKKSNGHKKQ